MTLLAIDIGNTNMKLGWFENGQPVLFRRKRTLREKPATMKAELKRLLKNDKNIPKTTDQFVLSSVVPSVTGAIEQILEEIFGKQKALDILTVKPAEIKTPVDMGNYPVNKIGADRFANLAAARMLHPGKAVILTDFGTATTFNVLNAQGRFLGGNIIPGLQTFWDVLKRKTAQLPEIPMEPTDKILGENTVDSIQAGLSMGYTGMVMHILEKLKAATGAPDVLTLATGGNAEKFVKISRQPGLFQKPDLMLTLKGLVALFEVNRKP